MRAALCLLTMTLLLPLAAADQHVSAGPASADTTTSDVGSCEMGSSGVSSRAAMARAQLTQSESVFVDARSSCSANAWSDGSGNYWNTQSSFLGVSAGRQTDNTWGPYASVSWFDNRDESHWGGSHFCGSQVYVSGLALLLGCWPEGESPPMLPALP